MKSGNIAYLGAIDQLRGIAAIWIVAYHTYLLMGHYLGLGTLFTMTTSEAEYLPRSLNPLTNTILVGHTAVSLFMVLSGFIFSFGAYGRAVAYGPFMRNRLLRVMPLWATLLLFSVLTSGQPVSLSQLVDILLPMTPANSTNWTPFLSMFWSLSIEFQFYLIFPLLFAVASAVGHERFLLRLIVVMVMLRIFAGLFGAQTFNLSYYSILGRIDQFALGMLLGVLYAKGRITGPWPARLLPLLILGLMIFAPLTVNNEWHYKASIWTVFRPTLEGGFWMLVVGCYLTVAHNMPRWLAYGLERAGEISFSVYMLHISVIWILCTRDIVLRPNLGPYLDVAVNLLVVVLPLVAVVATLTYRGIEAPFLMLRSQYLGSTPPVKTMTHVTTKTP